MAGRRREFVDSRLRRCPPDRASAVSYGQAGENALRFPHLAHRSAAVHKLHRATTAARIDFDSGKGETFSRLRALAYSSRNLSRRPGPPHPFPTADDRQKQRIRIIAEDLDAHRKRVLTEHPHLTLTGLYNVLEKLRAGTAPDALETADRRIFDDGLVLILKEYHDELDTAVAAAYGWPADLSDNDILVRLVALNRERVKEEAAGQVRWLRPDYQIPRFGGAKGKLALTGGAEPGRRRRTHRPPTRLPDPGVGTDRRRSVSAGQRNQIDDSHRPRCALQARPPRAAADGSRARRPDPRRRLGHQPRRRPKFPAPARRMTTRFARPEHHDQKRSTPRTLAESVSLAPFCETRCNSVFA